MMSRDLPGEKILAARQYEKEREYWHDKLAGEPVKTGFPPDISIPGTKERKPASISFALPGPLWERLKTIGNNSDSRLHMLLVAGLSLLLHKYTGHTDIIIGTPIDKQEIEGEFINTILALRNPIHDQITVKEFLMQVRQTIIEASQHQNYPLETIANELGIPMEEDDFPLFDTAILLKNIQEYDYIKNINLNMIFSFHRTGQDLESSIEYNAAIYEQETIRRIIKHFLHLLQEAFNHVDLKLVDVPVLTPEEKKQVIFDFNQTTADYPQEKMIQQLFQDQVDRTPGNIAAASKDAVLTYKELNEKSNRLARLLRAKGIKPEPQQTPSLETTAAIMLESSLEVPLAIMAVLKAGGAYLPIGFEYPAERIDYLLEDSKTRLLLTRKSLVENMDMRCPILYLDDPELYSGNHENPEPLNHKDSLAYIIYTSGTTGQPKGVMVEHRALVNYIFWAARTYVKGEPLDFPLYTSISFDLTVTSIFTPLITGNAIIIYGGKDREFYIEKVIDDNRVDVVKMTPSHLKLIKHKKVKNSRIKRLIVGGEELETQLAREIYNNFAKNIEIYNEYGPTETTVGSMIYKFDFEADTRHSVPIGIPIANTRVYLLNQYLQPVPPGAAAELYIAGDGLARGYAYNPGLTREKFLPDPFVPGQRMYSTGDLAVRLPDGNIEYRGRRDHQVKIRGYRVETGEIEAKIVKFQEMTHSQREQKESIVEKLDLKAVRMCKTCMIPVNYPGGIHFDENGVCDICREFATYKNKALAYFKTTADFRRVVEKARQTKKSDYDCLMLYSGGKDSSYVLHRLKEMGLNVLAFTFDNGYISKTAFENIERTTKLLNVPHIIKGASAMKEIFVESLWSDYNVCNGCFKAVNTLGTKLAHEHNINLVVSGLTRGQIFDIKLHGLFKLGIFDEQSIEEKLKLFRQNYHAMTHRTSRLIDVEITDDMLENIYFADYYRYDNVTVSEIFAYLQQKDSGWVRPVDTGASSSNCIINDVGIYVHLKDKGCHFYAPQLSWDCRLGTITREEGIEEITGFKVDYPGTRRVLKEIGYYDAFTGAVVVDITDPKGDKALCAYILADKDFDISQLRAYLARELPDYMIPSYFTKIDKIPLTPGGKIDRGALPAPELNVETGFTPPETSVGKRLAEVWSELLGLKKENIGIDVNFFEIGGHSLRATSLSAAVQKEFDVKLPLVKIFETPTIRGLETYISESVKEAFEPIRPLEKKEYYPLSSAQERLYVLHQLELDSTAYNTPLVVEMAGEIAADKIRETFKKLIQRHESLRTSFHLPRHQPVQKIHDEVAFEIEYYDVAKGDTEGTRGLAPLSEESHPSSSDVIRHLSSGFIRPFDLSRAPLIRVGMIELSHTPAALRAHPSQEGKEDRYLLLVDMHHIISDGVSTGMLIEDFTAVTGGKELPALNLQYKDFSQWQNREKEKKSMKQKEAYWLKEFQQDIPVLNLPADYSRPVLQSFAGNIIDFELSEKETAALNQLARTRGATLFMVLLAVYNVFLSKISSQEDIVVGTPSAGRKYAGLEQIIGMFVNTLALRAYPLGDKSFTGFLSDIKGVALKAFENQEYQFEDLVEKVGAERRDMSRNPLFDTMFILQNLFDPYAVPAQTKTQTLNIKPYTGEDLLKTSKFDLSLIAVEREEKLYFTFEYCTRLFKEETIRGFIQYFKKIAAALVESPDMKISALEIISREQKNKILHEFNDTGADYPQNKTIDRLFREQVERTPDYIAVVASAEREYRTYTTYTTYISYRQLNEKSDRLAQSLIERGSKPGAIVGIMVEPSIEMMVGLFGILKAGSAYLPIDPGYPQERIDYMLKDSHTRTLVTVPGLSEKLSIVNCQLLIVNEIPSNRRRLDNPPKEANSINNLQLKGNPLAYIIYTSGSTGKPKGVMVEHRSVVNLLSALYKSYPLMETDVYLLKTSFVFDVSVSELFGWYWGGARLAILAKDRHKDPWKILDTIQSALVTHINFVPSMFNVFLDVLAKKSISKLSGLKYIFLAGEVLLPSLVERFRRLGTGIVLENIYGPTEGTVYNSVYSLSPWQSDENIPIGKPIQNTKLYIVGKDNHWQPVGIPGELCISGTGLARGYLNNPGLTAERFIELEINIKLEDREYRSHRSHRSYITHLSNNEEVPGKGIYKLNQKFLRGGPGGALFSKSAPPGRRGQNLYKTGDLACWRVDGNIEFLGRMDHQVKIRGFRVELEEIENRLLKHEKIKEAVVIMRTRENAGPGGDNYLCAYILEKGDLDISQLKSYLARHLPDYMIPRYFVKIAKVPVTSSGKPDRKALPEPGPETGVVGYTPPGNLVEMKLAVIWSEVLGIEKGKIGIHDNFFHLGGHSLTAATAAARIHKEFNVQMPLAQLFKTPAIKEIADIISTSGQTAFIDLEKVEKREYYQLSANQARLRIIHRLQPDSPAYNMPEQIVLEHPVDPNLFKQAVYKIMERHESLRTGFKQIDETPVQFVTREIEVPFESLDISSLEESEKQRRLDQIFRREAGKPFQLEKSPLFRTVLVKKAEEEFYVIFNMHHIVSDGWSMEILKREFFHIYEAVRNGREVKLEPLEWQYKDFAAWHNKQLKNPALKEKSHRYWLQKLKGGLPVLELPGKLKNAGPDQGSAAYRTVITKEKKEKLAQLAVDRQTSLFNVMYTLFNMMLSHFTGQKHIVCGIPAAGRDHVSLQKIIGFFINTLVIETRVANEESFNDLLKKVGANMLETLQHQGYPLELLLDDLQMKFPEISVFFNMLNLPGTIANEKLESDKSFHIEKVQDVKFDMAFYNIEYENGVEIQCHYKRTLFKPGAVEHVIKEYIKILDFFSENPAKTLKDYKETGRKVILRRTAEEKS